MTNCNCSLICFIALFFLVHTASAQVPTVDGHYCETTIYGPSNALDACDDTATSTADLGDSYFFSDGSDLYVGWRRCALGAGTSQYTLFFDTSCDGVFDAVIYVLWGAIGSNCNEPLDVVLESAISGNTMVIATAMQGTPICGDCAEAGKFLEWVTDMDQIVEILIGWGEIDPCNCACSMMTLSGSATLAGGSLSSAPKDEFDNFTFEYETVTNECPIANFLPNSDVCVGTQIQFDATISYDTPGEMLTYQWDIDGTPYMGATPTHTFNNAGTANISVTVTDSYGCTDVQSINIAVNDGTSTSMIVCPSDLNISCSSPDIDGTIASWINASELGLLGSPGIVTVTNNYIPGTILTSCGTENALPVTYMTVDECGVINNCIAYITVIDDDQPFIGCPPTLNLECNDPNNNIFINNWILSAAATDCGSVTFTNDYNPNNLITSCGGAGTIPVTVTATDNCNNASNCSFNITITDMMQPTIGCPTNLSLEVGDINNPTLISAWLNSATHMDDCGSTTVTNTYSEDGFISDCGMSGLQNVIFTVTDECGNINTCNSQITMGDSSPPVITCPADLILECNDPNTTTIVNNWLASVITEPDAMLINSYNPGILMFQCGSANTFLINFTSTDACGLMSNCTSNIILQDTELPTITCPPATTIGCDPTSLNSINTWLQSATATDQCGAVQVTTNFGTATLGCDPNSAVIVTFTATDQCNNTSSCTSELIYSDQQNPTINCPQGLTLECAGTNNDTQINTWLTMVSGMDDCGSVTFTNNYSLNNYNQTCGNAGTQIVTFTVSDNCGKTEQCTSTITLQDTQLPQISCISNLNLGCADTSNDTQISAWLNSISGTDACGSVSITNSYSPSGFVTTCGDSGMQTVTFTITDDCSNINSCTAIIVVSDDSAPTLTCPGTDLIIECGDPNIDNLISDWEDSIVSNDECAAPTIISNYSSAGFSDLCGMTGIQLVTFTANDPCGNLTQCTGTIIINDTTNPDLSCPATDLVIECNDPNMNNLITQWENTVVSSDACGSTITESSFASNGFTDLCGGTGTQQVTFTTTDLCDNVSQCTGLITIEDTTDPTASCPPGLNLECAATNNDALINTWLTMVSGMDNCGNVTYINNYNANNYVQTCGNAGTQEVTFTVSDECNRTSECTSIITIQDTGLPQINCIPNLNLSCADTNNDILISSWLASITGSDACGSITIDNSYSVSGYTFTCGNAGSQDVTFTITDECNNTNSCISIIMVNDASAPTLSCPSSDLIIECDDPNMNNLISEWEDSVISDDECTSPNISSSYSPNNFSDLCGATGLQIVTFTAIDPCDNITECTATIIIQDTTDPVISCPEDLYLECADPNNETLISNWLNSFSSNDDCSPTVNTNNYEPMTAAIGCAGSLTYSVTFSGTDDCNNVSSCLQQIFIQDNTPPEITCPPTLDIFCGDPQNQDLFNEWLSGTLITDECGTTGNLSTDISFSQIPDECGITVPICITTTDECGNGSNCKTEVVTHGSSIGDLVWEDLNADGIQQPNEPGFFNILVLLYDSNGNLLETMVTDENGNYGFTDLYPGDYFVVFQQPNEYDPSPENLGADDSMDSDVDNSNGLGSTIVVTLVPGGADISVDAGFYTCAYVGDVIWNDSNGNGIQDTDENGVNGVTVEIYRKDTINLTWVLIDSAITGADISSQSGDGYYSFCVDPGEYYVKFLIENESAFIRPDQGRDDTVDSDVTHYYGTGTTNAFTTESGGHYSDNDAGLTISSSLIVTIWLDQNNDGIFQGTEPVLEGVTTMLNRGNGSTENTITSGEDGLVIFDDVPVGMYYLEVEIPEGLMPTLPNRGEETNDSDLDHMMGPNTTDVFELEGGQNMIGIDIGLVDPTSNANMNCPTSLVIQCNEENREEIISEWLESGLYDSACPVEVTNDYDPDNFVSGCYDDMGEQEILFTIADTCQNVYTCRSMLEITDTTAPSITCPNQLRINFSDPNLRSSIISWILGAEASDACTEVIVRHNFDIAELNMECGSTHEVQISVDDYCGNQNTCIARIMNTGAEIGDRVWYDRDEDGIQDSDEDGLAGVTVNLYDEDDNQVATTISDQHGRYYFELVDEGRYYMTFTPPQGYSPTLDGVGDNNTNSDVVLEDNAFMIRPTNIRAARCEDGLDAGFIESSITLALTSLDLEGKYLGTHNLLNWDIYSEVNLSHYTILRGDSKNTEMVSISKVLATEYNDPAIFTMTYEDYDLQRNGLYYYKIIAVDLNGIETHSQIVAVHVPLSHQSENFYLINYFPNPVNQELNINISNIDRVKMWDLQVFDALGQKIYEFEYDDSNSSDRNLTKKIRTTEWADGIYFLRTNIGGFSHSKRILVAH